MRDKVNNIYKSCGRWQIILFLLLKQKINLFVLFVLSCFGFFLFGNTSSVYRHSDHEITRVDPVGGDN